MGIDDPQDEAEALDDDEVVGGEYPPDRPLAVEEYGITPAEERVPEPLEEFVKREQPDRLRPRRPQPPGLIDPASIEGFGDEPDVIALSTDPLDEVLPEDDVVSGDETERDYATELEAPPPAEEAAIHVVRNPR